MEILTYLDLVNIIDFEHNSLKGEKQVFGDYVDV